MTARKLPSRPKTRANPPKRRPRETDVWERVMEIARTISDEELARWPRDLAKNFDDYDEGAKRS